MANNFDDDARIIEYWLFENNLTAGKAGNNLTASAGGVGYESGTPMEGAYSLDLEYSNNQWAYRTDANLSSGFPLKNGDTTKKVSWAFWMKLESLPSLHYIVSKYNVSSKRSLALIANQTDGNFSLLWGITNGTSSENFIITSVATARKYHIGIAVDGIAKTALVRLYDDSTQIATTYTKTDYVNELYISDADFVVGDRGNRDGTNNYDGIIDEIVVANDLLSVDEFDAIRNGTFGASASFSPSISPSPSASTSLSPSLSLSLSPSKSPSVPATTGRSSFLIF